MSTEQESTWCQVPPGRLSLKEGLRLKKLQKQLGVGLNLQRLRCSLEKSKNLLRVRTAQQRAKKLVEERNRADMAFRERGPTSLTKGSNVRLNLTIKQFEETGRFWRQLWEAEPHHDPTHPELVNWRKEMREKAMGQAGDQNPGSMAESIALFPPYLTGLQP